GGGDGQVRAADGQNVGRHGRIPGYFAVADGGDEGDAAVAGRRREVTVVAGLAGELRAAVAHGHHADAGRVTSGVDSRVQVAEGVRAALHEHDRGAWGNGVRPLHVERLLRCPAAGGIDAGGSVTAELVDLDEARRIGQGEGAV